MQHRIRAAGLLVEGDHILMVKVKDFSGEYWIPPGGGLEPDDKSSKACLKREFWEETGLDVDIGRLLAVREFLETSAERYNAEFFYHVTGYRGTPHTNNLQGLNDQQFIQTVEWVSLAQLAGRRTYPANIVQLVERLAQGDYSHHLGSYVQGDNDDVDVL
ncbi:NUDIX domain-containing protein [Vibrio sp.]|uniref:NUDIX domain-containing protein n=1 Tax=Vibrio sp. TaxID=678 RepID=UPI003D0B288F